MKSHAAITVDLAANTASGGHAEGDVLLNIERLVGSAHDDSLTGDDKDNILQGRDGDDYLYGGEGNDRLVAGNDNDTLDGGVGADTLFGGDGNDTFYFSSFRLKYTDIIADFGNSDDIIHLVHMKTEDIRIASGHGEAIRQNDYGDSTVEDAILYQTHGTADHEDDTAFLILSDFNADGLILTEGTNYITIA